MTGGGMMTGGGKPPENASDKSAVAAGDGCAPWPTQGARRLTTWAADCSRCAGSLAIMSASTSTNSALSGGFSRRGSSGRNSQWARALSAVVPPGNGTLPVTA